MSHQTARYMNTGGDPDERNITNYISVASGGAINHSTAYALSIRFLMFHVKHIERRTHNGIIQTIGQTQFWCN